MMFKKQNKMTTIFFSGLFVAIIMLLIANLRSPNKKIHHRIVVDYGVTDPQFTRSLSYLIGPAVLDGNKVKAFYNGDEIFPAMLNAISKAEKTITFESYIYWAGEIGSKFVDALSERSRAGVKVHVLIDWLGSSKIEDSYIERLKDAGAEIEFYRPAKWFNISRINNRSHRKILVIDGKVGFTGGVGISDDWAGNADKPERWRDSHFQIEGPAVAQMQLGFMNNWLKTKPEVYHDEVYFPEIQPSGTALAQFTISNANEGSQSLRLLYLLSMAAAKNSILISNAYFVPDDASVDEIIRAKKRGVRVEIIVPGKNTDSDLVLSASKAQWKKLLEAGVEIYQYEPSRFHCKVLIIDNFFVSVGSTNFDDRSFRLNDEANLNILDKDFANRESLTFEKDKANSKKVLLAEWKKRPFYNRIFEKFAKVLSPQF